jgi:hypothetical protein
VTSDWREFGDPQRSLALARDMLDDIAEKDLGVDKKLEYLARAAEPVLDAPNGNPIWLYRAANVLAKEQRDRERNEPLTDEQILRARVTITENRLRGLHCAGLSDLAMRHGMAAWTAIENHAGGKPGDIQRALAHGEPTVAGELGIQIAGRLAAAAKRALPLGTATRERWGNEFRSLVDAYIPNLNAEATILYPGTPALVQILYFFVEDGDPLDRPRIMALRDLDEIGRPKDRRGQATIPMRDAAIARYEGNTPAFEEHSAAAWSNLKANHLQRHIDMATQHEYLEDDDGQSEVA